MTHRNDPQRDALPEDLQRQARQKTCEHSYEQQYEEKNGQRHYVRIWHCTACGELTQTEPVPVMREVD